MDRAEEMRDLRRTMREQEAWGKLSVRSANRLAELEAEERVERWGFDPLCLATCTFALAYCLLFCSGWQSASSSGGSPSR